MRKKTKQKVGYKTFPKIIKYFKNHKLILTVYLFIAIISIAIGFFELIIVGNLLASLGQLDIDMLILLFSIYFILKLIAFVSNYYWSKLGDLLGIRIISEIRNESLSHMLNIKAKVFDRSQTEKFKERLINDGNAMIWNFIDVVNSSIEIIASILFIAYIFILNIYIGLLLTVFIVIYYFIDKQKNKLYLKNQRNWKNKADEFNSYGNEVIKGIRDIKILNAKPSIANTFGAIQKEFYDIYYNRNLTNNRFWFFLRLLSTIFFIAVIALGVYLITIGEFTLAGLLIIYLSYEKIRNITFLFTQIREKSAICEVSAQRAFEIQSNHLDFEKEKFGLLNSNTIGGDIEFKNVTFGYKPENLIYNNLNLQIKPGQVVGIVGESGGGKSTLLNLISKLYYINSGEVLIDGININEYSEESLRNTISYVNQYPYLFNDTIENNLKLSNNNLTLNEIIEACKIANIHDYIISTPHGYNTVIGENGVQLSGGQRQRLSIARAILNKSKIALLDESTSALDNENQQKIKQSLKQFSENRTIIMVAHRLSTIIDSDRIIAFQNGKIVADGTHKELLSKNKYYQKLYNTNAINE